MKLLESLVAFLALVSCEPKHDPTDGLRSTPMERITFTCDTDEECAALPPCKAKPGCNGSPNTTPFKYVGYDCRGATEPLYRDDVTHFPKCEEIREVNSNY